MIVIVAFHSFSNSPTITSVFQNELDHREFVTKQRLFFLYLVPYVLVRNCNSIVKVLP